MSTTTDREAQASLSEYFGVISSVGSEVRQVVNHLISFGFLPAMRVGRKLAFKRSATSLGVRCLSGETKPCGAEGTANEGSNQGRVV